MVLREAKRTTRMLTGQVAPENVGTCTASNMVADARDACLCCTKPKKMQRC